MKKVLFFSLIFICLIVFGIYKSNLGEQFKISLISEIIGSGLLGLFITFISFLLQDRMRDSIQKEEALSLVESNILPTLKQINFSGPTTWSLYDDEQFWLHATMINPLHSFYKGNILTLKKVFNFNSDIGNQWCQFNDLVLSALVLARKLDSIINQKVRAYHHSKSLARYNDGKLEQLIRATLVDLPMTEVIKHLDVKEVYPQEKDEIISQIKNDSEISVLLKELLENKENLKEMCIGIMKSENYLLK